MFKSFFSISNNFLFIVEINSFFRTVIFSIFLFFVFFHLFFYPFFFLLTSTVDGEGYSCIKKIFLFPDKKSKKTKFNFIFFPTFFVYKFERITKKSTRKIQDSIQLVMKKKLITFLNEKTSKMYLKILWIMSKKKTLRF